MGNAQLNGWRSKLITSTTLLISFPGSVISGPVPHERLEEADQVEVVILGALTAIIPSSAAVKSSSSE